MTKPRPDGWAHVSVPQWLWGGAPAGLFDAAHLLTRVDTDGTGLIRTEESYRHTRPDLLRFLRAAGPTARPDGLSQLSLMSDDAIDQGVLRGHEDFLGSEMSRLNSNPGLQNLVTFHQLASMSASMTNFPAQAEATLDQIREVKFADDQAQTFPHAGVYAIRRDDALIHRIKIISVLLRMEHDPKLAAGDTSGIRLEHEESERGAFASSGALHSGYWMLDAYVGPLLGALTPGVWGFAAHRGRGPVIYSFGRAVAGSSSTAPELLRTIQTPGADSAVEFVDLAPDVVPSAINWWAERLNDLFGVITDPAVFVDGGGRYQPVIHLETILTVEQLFRRVVSIQVNHHDLNARQVLMFSVLDTLHTLTSRPLEKNCDAVFAHRRLRALEDGMPVSAAALLLPRARESVDALERVQDGFFLLEDDGRVLTEPSRGRTDTPAGAAAQYMKMLRNATHGHGPTRGPVELSRTLLARHDGKVPHDVALLAWLYLLDLLANPEALRLRLSAAARRAGARFR